MVKSPDQVDVISLVGFGGASLMVLPLVPPGSSGSRMALKPTLLTGLVVAGGVGAAGTCAVSSNPKMSTLGGGHFPPHQQQTGAVTRS